MLPHSKRTLGGAGCTSSPTWLSFKLQPLASIIASAETSKHELITVSNLNASPLQGSTYLEKGGDNSPHGIHRDTELCGHLGAFLCHNRGFTFPTADLGRENQAQGPACSHSSVPQPCATARPSAHHTGTTPGTPIRPGLPTATRPSPHTPAASSRPGYLRGPQLGARRGCAALARKNAKTRPPAPLHSAPGAAHPSAPPLPARARPHRSPPPPSAVRSPRPAASPARWLRPAPARRYSQRSTPFRAPCAFCPQLGPALPRGAPAGHARAP